jgi:hypothetical protein
LSTARAFSPIKGEKGTKTGGSKTMQISGQTVVTTAGSAVSLGSQAVNAPLMVKALDTNSGVVALGNDGSGDLDMDDGLRMEAGDAVVFEFVSHLSALKVNSSSDGDGVSWLVLSV